MIFFQAYIHDLFFVEEKKSRTFEEKIFINQSTVAVHRSSRSLTYLLPPSICTTRRCEPQADKAVADAHRRGPLYLAEAQLSGRCKLARCSLIRLKETRLSICLSSSRSINSRARASVYSDAREYGKIE